LVSIVPVRGDLAEKWQCEVRGGLGCGYGSGMGAGGARAVLGVVLG